jgi:hypothetical protein
MRERFPFGFVFLVGLIAGMLMMNFGKSILLENTGLLGEDTLRQISSVTLGGSALFAFVLRKRMTMVLFLILAATTYLGLVVCAATALWYGVSVGAFLAACVLRFGIKGILLALAGTMPQYLLYGPGLYALLVWGEQTYRMIYGRECCRGRGDTKAPILSGRVLFLCVIILVFLMGCGLESFANPAILSGFLKICLSAQ